MRILGVTASSYEAYPAYESIATATGTGSSGTITFSSIPSTYQHLQIRFIAKFTADSTNEDLNITINSDTGSNYAWHRLRGNGSTVSAAGAASASNISIKNAVIGSLTVPSLANRYSVGLIDIHDYASTSKTKTIKVMTGWDANGDATGYITLQSGLWNSTSALNSITLTVPSLNFTTASTFALYGIKGA